MNMKILGSSFTILLLVITFIPGISQELRLDEAVAIGLENNFDVKIARNNTDISRNNYQRGNAGSLPFVQWTGSRNSTRSNVKQTFINGNVNERNGATSNVWNTGVALNWTIFDGLGMFKTYQKLGQLYEAGELDQKIAYENTIEAIILNYNRIILEKNLISALDSNLRLSAERVNISKSSYEVGKAPKLDYLTAQVDYNTDFSALIKQRENYQKAKYELNNILGRAIDTSFEVQDNIRLDSSLQIDVLKTNAMMANNSLLRTKRTGSIAQLEVAEIKSERLPQLGLNLGYNYSNLSSEAGFLLSNQSNGLNYGASASWNLFDGNNVRRRYQNAEINYLSSQVSIEQIELEINLDLENQYLEYTNNILLVNLEQQNLQVALESSNLALERYRVGRSSFIELREAQINALRAYGRLVNAIYNAKVNEIELQRLSGQIIGKDFSTPN
jgi:outer membrane protein TolC